MRELVKDLTNYLYVGIFPNSVAAFSAYIAIDCAVNGYWEGFLFNTFSAGLNSLIGLGKFSEYEKIKEGLEERGWDERLVKPKMYSWCQRHSSRLAAKQLGYLEEFNEFAEREGHKWYHFLPKAHRLGELLKGSH